MRLAYLDCFAGVSGDMFLGALVDAGLGFDAWREQMTGMGVPGLDCHCYQVSRRGLRGTKVDVVCHDPAPPRRNLAEIERIIGSSGLGARVRERSLAVFRRLAAAEAKVHGIAVDEVHFHEVGAWDSIVDVVGTVLGLAMLGVEEVQASPLHCGSGWIETAHGLLPVPAPAVAELLQGVPCYNKGIDTELVTPTGAALVTTLAGRFGPPPAMTVVAVGYGAGSRDLAIPNLLRLWLGETEPGGALPAGADRGWREETAVMLEANVDDLQPEVYGFLAERLFAAGAQDVFMTPIYMKKNRPAVTMSVLAPVDLADCLAAIIFQETTTLGLRRYQVEKAALPRQMVEVPTAWGPVRVKLGLLAGKVVTVAPEYDDCARIARESGVPLKEVYQGVLSQVKREGEPGTTGK